MRYKPSGESPLPSNRRHSGRLDGVNISYKENIASESDEVTSDCSLEDSDSGNVRKVSILPQSKSSTKVGGTAKRQRISLPKENAEKSTPGKVANVNRNQNTKPEMKSKVPPLSTTTRNSQRNKSHVNYVEISSDTEESSHDVIYTRKKTKRVSSDEEDEEWSE